MSTNFLGGGVVLDEAGRPLDQIVLTGITATGYHGVFPHERREGQVFLADVVVHLDTRRAAAADDLTRTVNYGDLADAVAGVLSGEPADLIETVAERIAATALADPGVAAVDVAVHKPQAPIEVPFDDVVVRIHRDHHKLPAAEPWRRPAEPARRDAASAGTRSAGTSGAEPVTASAPEPAAATPVPPAAGSGAAAIGAGVDQDAPGDRQPDRLDLPPAEPVEAVLALGANLGTPQSTLREAVADIERIQGVEILAVSPLARTAPVGGPGQPDFLNAVVIVRTTLSPRALLHAAQAVEQQHGRVRTEHWGPRTLDVDLITYGSTLAVTDDLELPHPRAHQRAFVLAPWAQVAPDAVLPGLGGGPVAALAATAPDRDGVRWMALDWMTAPLPRDAVRDDAGRDGAGRDDAVRDGAARDDGGQDDAARDGAGRDDGVRDRLHVPAEVPAAAQVIRSAGGATAIGAGEPVPAEPAAGTHVPGAGRPVPTATATPEPEAAEPDPYPELEPDADPEAARTSSATQGPLDWLPELPAPGATSPAGAGGGPRAPIFSPVVPPDDVPHPGDRQS